MAGRSEAVTHASGGFMRLLVTVVSPATRQSTDIVPDAEAATPVAAVAAVAAELDRFARGGDVGGGGHAGAVGGAGVGGAGAVGGAGRANAPSGAPLYVDRQRIWRRPTLAEAPSWTGRSWGGRCRGCRGSRSPSARQGGPRPASTRVRSVV
jgi:hypothetical protein